MWPRSLNSKRRSLQRCPRPIFEAEPENLLNRIDSPSSPAQPVHMHGQCWSENEVRDVFRGSPAAWGRVENESEDDEIDLTQMADELQTAAAQATPTTSSSSSREGPRCVARQLMRPHRHEDDASSTACNNSNVWISTPGGVGLGSKVTPAAHPCFGQPPGLAQVPSAPLPAMPSTGPSVQTGTAQTCPREWQPLASKPKSSPVAPPPGYNSDRAKSGGDGASNPGGGAPSGSGGRGSNPTSGGGPPGGPLEAIDLAGDSRRIPPPSPQRTPPQPTGGLVSPEEVLAHHLAHQHIYLLNDPLTHGHNRTVHASPPPPLFKLPLSYRTCSILDVRQLLEDWLSKSTFAMATWRGDAQRCWLEHVLEAARARHDQWLQSTPDQRASLEPAYILWDRKLIPEVVNVVESVLRTELLNANLASDMAIAHYLVHHEAAHLATRRQHYEEGGSHPAQK